MLNFFKEYAPKVDVFCLQEVFHDGKTKLEPFKGANMNLFNDAQKSLLDFKGYYHPTQTDEEGLAIFVKNTIEIKEAGDIFVFRSKDAMENGDTKTLGRNLQYVSVEGKGKMYLVCNFHGLWNGINKLDSEDRLQQSEKIVKFLNGRNEECKILCGDFNLLPDTESIKKFEDAGLRNLIREFGVTSTRTSFYTKPVKFADYVFISKDINLKEFKILPDEVSDHAPLLMEVM